MIKTFFATEIDGKGVFIDRSLTATVDSTSPEATVQAIKDACLPGLIDFTAEYTKPGGGAICTGTTVPPAGPVGAATQTELTQAHNFRFAPGDFSSFSKTTEKGTVNKSTLTCKDPLDTEVDQAGIIKAWSLVGGDQSITCSVTATLTLKDGAVCVTPEPLTITITKGRD